MIRQFRLFLFCAALALLFVPVWSAADSLSCQGTVDDLYVHKNGGVFAKGSWRGTWTQFCSLEEEWKGVSTSTCFGWYNLLLTMQREGATAKIRYSDSQESCDNLPAYNKAVPPDYVMMR